MFTSEEQENLQALLSHAVKPEEALGIEQLAGYLFGVVITPDETDPGEWFPDIFGESLARFDDEQQSNELFTHLRAAYKRFDALRLAGELRLPFDLEQSDGEMLLRLREFAVGLNKALELRSYIWLPEEALESDEMTPEQEEIMNCLMVVLGVAHQEQIPEIFEGIGEAEGELQEAWDNLAGELPMAVQMLQAHAAALEIRRLQAETKNPVTVAPKIGRNEPCPCGSGKKYKQCCGLH